jgi:hypothetical protein
MLTRKIVGLAKLRADKIEGWQKFAACVKMCEWKEGGCGG